MKFLLRYLIPAVGLAAVQPALCAEESTSPKSERKEMHVIIGPEQGPGPNWTPHHAMRMAGPREMESVTFLGVAAFPADPTLADQLNLPKGVGLVVTIISPDSPAATALKRHDVLVKLDDQVLIAQHQLAVLVRNHKEGDEVTLTLVRGSKEMTVKVKLGKHDVPKMAMMEEGPGSNFFNFHHLGLNDDEGLPDVGREEMDRVLSLIDRGGPGQEMRRVRIDRNAGPGMHTTTVSTNNSNMVFTDERGSLDLTIKEGKKNLVAKNAKGEQVFAGPVTTPEERKAMPAEVRERLEKLEGMQEFSFRTDEDFQGGKVQVVRPPKNQIAMPLPEETEPHRNAPF